MLDITAVLEFVTELLNFVPQVAPAAVLVAILIDGGKRLGWLPDGYAPLANAVLNVLFYTGFALVGEEGAADLIAVIGGMELVLPVVIAALLSNFAHSRLLKNSGLHFSHPN